MPTRRLIPTGYRKYRAKGRFSFNTLIIVCVFVSFGLSLGFFVGADASSLEKVAVVEVFDGDTIAVKNGGGQEFIVRLLGVDTPETQHPSKPVECFGREASTYTKNMLINQKIELEYDVQRYDKYDRTLAYVYLNGKRFNDDLVEQGYATILNIEPNSKYAHSLMKKEIEASNAGVGLWGKCGGS